MDKKFCYPILNGESRLTCKTSNVIYVISCSLCSLLYVGLTRNCLQKRMGGHRRGIRSNDSDMLVHLHFKSHKDHMLVFPIEKVVPSPDNSNLSRTLAQRELFWQLKLNSFYPFGLNIRIKGSGDYIPGNVNSTHISKPYRRLKNHGHRKPRRLRPRWNHISIPYIIQLHNTHIDSPFYISVFKNLLFQIPRKVLFELYRDCKNNVVILDQRILDMVSFVSNRRLFQPVKIHKSIQHRFLKIKFIDKGMDLINLGCILRSKSVINSLPISIENRDPPVVSYSYPPPISGKIFNYKQTSLNCSFDDFKHNVKFTCQCSCSPFKDNTHGHVITGDLNIINNPILKFIIGKGPKYRLPRKIDFIKGRKEISASVKNYCVKLANSERCNFAELDTYYNNIMVQVDNRISSVSYNFEYGKSIFFTGELKNELLSMQARFVIAPADKAGNNVIFICKEFYIYILYKELLDNPTSTYKKLNVKTQLPDIIKNIDTFCSGFGIRITDIDMDIPTLFWIPKLHKDPIKFRFVAGAKHCCTKSLSIVFSKIYKLILSHFEKYYNVVTSRTGVKYYWPIKSSLQVKNTLENVKVNHISSFDFSTLYTSLIHDDIKHEFYILFKEALQKEDCRFINVSYHKAFFSNKSYSNNLSFTLQDLMVLLHYYLDNIFIKVGGNIFQQKIGIPMGTNDGPNIADLLLFAKEFRFMRGLHKNNIILAKKFSYTFRYIDDLLSINMPTFDTFLSQIYGHDLKITNSSSPGYKVCNYLDLHCVIKQGILEFSIFDKRKSFKFKIVCFPYINSNVPLRPSLGVFSSQLVRYSNLCSTYADFCNTSKALSVCFLDNGFKCTMLRKQAINFYRKYNANLSKFLIKDVNDFISKAVIYPCTDLGGNYCAYCSHSFIIK